MIEQLRQERSLLAAEHKDLQRRYSKIAEVSLLHSTHVPNTYRPHST